MRDSVIILAAFCLDLILGDPYFIPHPVRGIGFLIVRFERFFRNLKSELLGGIFLVIFTVSITYGITYFLVSLSIVFEILLGYTIFAVTCLAREGMKVYGLLKAGEIEKAREAVSFLVSRDTSKLPEEEIIRAAIETVSENFVDGILAPLFYMVIGGVPLAMAYKAINTLDSMVGYKNEKYLYFGRAAARLDDFVNWLPARLGGFFFIPLGVFLGGFNLKGSLKIVKRDRFNHGSPNSGHPEAAIAGGLGIRIGGPARYHGKIEDKPFIGDKLRDFAVEDIKKCVKIIYLSAFGALMVLGGGKFIFSFFLFPGVPNG